MYSTKKEFPTLISASFPFKRDFPNWFLELMFLKELSTLMSRNFLLQKFVFLHRSPVVFYQKGFVSTLVSSSFR